MAPLYYCDHYEFALPEGHKFPTGKYRLLRGLLAADGRFTFHPAEPAPPETVALAHDAGYVSRFLTGALDPMAMRRIGFPWSEGLALRTLASVGGTLAASDQALRAGWGGNLAGGTHHAFRAEGAGFCVFNDIAVGIYALRARGAIRRAAVVDLDVHQGDGTAAIFENDAETLTISLHGRNNFPFRKQRSRVDVELEDGTGDDEYLRAVDGILPMLEKFGPDIVYYQSGVDGLASDKLGRLALTHEGLMERDRRVLHTCRDLGVPVAITLGGGYSDPIELTATAHANTFLVAAGLTMASEKSA